MATPVSLTHMVSLDDAALRGWPLPAPSSGAGMTGHVLLLAGARPMPDPAMLAGSAALRAGAGQLTVASAADLDRLDLATDQVSALLIGASLRGEADGAALVRALLARLAGVSTVLDGCAIDMLLGQDQTGGGAVLRFAQNVIITTQAGELARLCGLGQGQFEADPARHVASAAQAWNAVVVLQGQRSLVGAPDGGMWQHDGGELGLAVPGAGEVLAGIIAGLAARGAPPAQAACWGVALHAQALLDAATAR
jgi:ADP-dependent NAD(P)H-hydrate dehydratase